MPVKFLQLFINSFEKKTHRIWQIISITIECFITYNCDYAIFDTWYYTEPG